MLPLNAPNGVIIMAVGPYDILTLNGDIPVFLQQYDGKHVYKKTSKETIDCRTYGINSISIMINIDTYTFLTKPFGS